MSTTSSKTVSFISQSKFEKDLFKKYDDIFLHIFFDFHVKYGGFTDTDVKKIGRKLILAMDWEYAVSAKAQEVRYCFVKLIAAFEIWKQNKGSQTLVQYLEWFKYFLFQLYIYKEFAFRLINFLFPEIYGYDESTMQLERRMRQREEKNSVAEIPAELQKLFTQLDDQKFKELLSLRGQITHRELLQIVSGYKRSGEVLEIIKGKGLSPGKSKKEDPYKILEKAQRGYEVFVESCGYLGIIYSETLERWSVESGVIVIKDSDK